MLKRYIATLPSRPQTAEGLFEAAKTAWNVIEQEKIHNIADRMKKRVLSFKKTHGLSIKY